MSVTVDPPNANPGQIVNLQLQYQGNPPIPNDVHVEAESGGSWVPVTGYDHIPAGANPANGIDLPLPPTGAWSTPGLHRLRVRWTFNGDVVGTEMAYVTVNAPAPPPAPTPASKEWDWGVFLGKVLGGSASGAVSSLLLNWWTLTAIVVCVATGALGGAVGGAVGQFFVWLFDAPKIQWNLKSAFLFVLFFGLAFSMVLGLLAINLEQSAAAQGDTLNRVTLGGTAVSAFLAAILAGVLNNLRDGS
ncbi:MAG TPA: hypothetical protein VLY24_00880 [Bryobacteraceae bacterium]|nr:hypothetical protein [Bryobacteraceae bacterium]